MRLLKGISKNIFLSLSLIGVLMTYQACTDKEGLAGTTTTAENGIHGVAKQSDGSYFPEASIVSLKRFLVGGTAPGFKIVEQAKVQELGKFYIPIKDTGQFVLEIESALNNSEFQRTLINVDDVDSLYQLDTLRSVETIARPFKILFESSSDWVKKDSVWLGQLGMESLIPIQNMDIVTIPNYDPELSDLILLYVDVQGVLRTKTLQWIEPEQFVLDISRYFTSDSMQFVDTGGEIKFED